MSKHILVVEDHEDYRQIIRDLLAAADYQLTKKHRQVDLRLWAI